MNQAGGADTNLDLTGPDWGVSEAARALHADCLVWDATFPFRRDPHSHTPTLRNMAAAGYTCVSATVALDPYDMPAAIRQISVDRQYLLARADKYLIVETPGDVVKAKERGLLGLVLSFQGTTPFERDLALVELFYKLGIRHALMAYNQKNHVGDGCHERTDAGLSRFGCELVAEMERVGMIVDCTHTGFRTTMDVMEAATKPVIFSHSGPRALWDHERNIKDEQIRACAATGGVVGLTGVGIFMGENDIRPETMFRQIDYVAELVGPKHVGLGFDFVADTSILMAAIRDNAARYPDGQYTAPDISFAPPSTMPKLTEQMLNHGYPEADIRGILGLNWLRVAKACWASS